MRAWEWPASDHLIFLGFLGILQGIIAYCGAQAYRLAQAADVAPFEYAALPLAISWGWAVFGDLPSQWAMIGMCLIAGTFYRFMSEKTNRAKTSPLETIKIATVSFCNHAEAAGQLMALCRGLRTRIQRQRELRLVF